MNKKIFKWIEENQKKQNDKLNEIMSALPDAATLDKNPILLNVLLLLSPLMNETQSEYLGARVEHHTFLKHGEKHYEGFDILVSMHRQVAALIRRYCRDNAQEKDFLDAAFIACEEAAKKYYPLRNRDTKMQRETYAHWYITKAFEKLSAQQGRVIQYRMFSPTGEYLRVISQNRYWKIKKVKESQGYRFERFEVRSVPLALEEPTF